MKKILTQAKTLISIMLILILASSCSVSGTVEAKPSIDRTNIKPPVIQGGRAILIDVDTDEVIWEKNADDKHILMSTTKIFTAAVIMRSANPRSKEFNYKKYPRGLKTPVKVTRKAAVQWGSCMGLMEGERLTVEELLYGLMMQSANDAAKALAIHHSGSISKFAKAMKKVAVNDIGMKPSDATFSLPHMKARMSARSLAKASKYLLFEAMGHNIIEKISKTKKKTISAHEGDGEYHHQITLKNSNPMLKKGKYRYEGIMGLKTGTDIAYGEFVGAASRVIDGNRVTLISVVLASDPYRRFNDTKYMLNYGFGLKNTKSKENPPKRIHPAICYVTGGNHQVKFTPKVAATSKKNGKTAGARCSVCGKLMLPRFTILSKGMNGKKIVLRKSRQWADQYDAATNTYTKLNRVYTFTGKEKWVERAIYPDGIFKNKVFAVKKSSIPGLSAVPSGGANKMYCTYYGGLSRTYHTAVIMNHNYMYVDGEYINFEKPSGQTLAQFKKWVKSAYKEGKPLRIVYPI